MEPARNLIVLMGPSGCGKSTVGKCLADALGFPFVEGDDFHPPENVRKMAAGQPLSDADRTVWIDALVAECRSRAEPALVLACSALTPYVQSRLRAQSGRIARFLLLELPRAELMRRLNDREGHFMPPMLADSQLAALDPPGDALRLDATLDPQTIAGRACSELGYGR